MKVYIVIPTLDPKVAEVTGEFSLSKTNVDAVVRIVHDWQKLGATRSLNIGFREGVEGGADYLCYLNDDSSDYQEGWLERMIEALEEDDDYVIAVTGGPCRSGVQRNCKPGMPKEVVEIPRGAWFCVVIKRKAFEKLGYLDERFSHYGSDGDFSFRAREKGLKTICVKDVYVHHDLAKPVQPWWREDSDKMKRKWRMGKYANQT
jgi:GT2 family glycosyltransferase